jgi:Cytochrome c
VRSVAGLLMAAAVALGAPGSVFAQPPRQLYLLNCWGCHRPHGEGIPGVAPPLIGSADFLKVPAGRAYLIEVPGVALSALDDAQIASVMNWILRGFSSDRLPGNFRPYTAGEVAKYRAVRLLDVAGTRKRLLAEMVKAKTRPPEAARTPPPNSKPRDGASQAGSEHGAGSRR